MATIKGTFASNNANVNLYIVWSSTQNTSANTSSVTAKLYVKRVTSYATTYKNSTPYSITVNGETSSGTKSINVGNLSVGESLLVATKTVTVNHNSDGKKSIKISGKVDFSGCNPGVGTVPSTSVTLPSIARASTFSTSGTKTIGSTVTINITRASSSFTHTVQVSFNGGSYSNIATGVGTSTTYTLPSSWASSMTSSTAPFKIKVITYNGSTKIGEKINSYTVTLSNTYAPTIDTVAVSEGNSAVTTGVFVQNLSKLKIQVTATAKGGATIKTYTYKLNGTTVVSGTSSSVTTSTITDVGTVTLEIIVTDSKGLSATFSRNINVVGQGDINIGTLKAVRTNSSGTADENGSYFTVYCTLSSTFSMTVYVQYKMSSSSSWNSKSLGSLGTSYTLNWYNPNVNIGTLYSYDVRLKVSTPYATKYSKTVSITPSYVIMDFKSDGNGICFGSTCTQNGVEVKGQDFYMTKGYMRINRYTDTGESRVMFPSCGSENLSMYLYGGNSTSTTRFGLYDSTNSTYVWKYHSTNKLYVGVKMFMVGDRIEFQNSDGGDNACDAVYINRDTDIIYFGSGSNASSVPESRMRGSSVRLYAHSGGGVYLGTSGSTAITSDKNLKKNIENLDDKYLKFFEMLRPVTFIYKDNGHRKHIGFIAQEVEEALLECGLTTEDFAGLVKETNVDVDVEGDKTVHYDEIYSLRYEEFIALNTRVLQGLIARIEELEKKVL